MLANEVGRIHTMRLPYSTCEVVFPIALLTTFFFTGPSFALPWSSLVWICVALVRVRVDLRFGAVLFLGGNDMRPLAAFCVVIFGVLGAGGFSLTPWSVVVCLVLQIGAVSRDGRSGSALV